MSQNLPPGATASPANDPTVLWTGTHDQKYMKYPENLQMNYYSPTLFTYQDNFWQMIQWYNERKLTREDALKYEQIQGIPPYKISTSINQQDLDYHNGVMDPATAKIYLDIYNHDLDYATRAITQLNPVQLSKDVNTNIVNGLKTKWSSTENYKPYDSLSDVEKQLFYMTFRFTYPQAYKYALKVEDDAKKWKIDHPDKPKEENCDDYLKNTGSWYNPASYITSPISSVKGITDYILCKLKKAGGGLVDVANAAINKIKEYFWDAVKFLEISAIVLGLIILGALGLITYFSWYTSPIRGAKVTYDYEIGQADKLAKQKGISRQEALKQVAARQIALGATNPAALVGETFINTLPEGAVDTSAIDAAIPAVM